MPKIIRTCRPCGTSADSTTAGWPCTSALRATRPPVGDCGAHGELEAAPLPAPCLPRPPSAWRGRSAWWSRRAPRTANARPAPRPAQAAAALAIWTLALPLLQGPRALGDAGISTDSFVPGTVPRVQAVGAAVGGAEEGGCLGFSVGGFSDAFWFCFFLEHPPVTVAAASRKGWQPTASRPPPSCRAWISGLEQGHHPGTPRLPQPPTLFFSEYQIHNPTPANVRPFPAAVREDVVVVAARVLKCIGQDRHRGEVTGVVHLLRK